MYIACTEYSDDLSISSSLAPPPRAAPDDHSSLAIPCVTTANVLASIASIVSHRIASYRVVSTQISLNRHPSPRSTLDAIAAYQVLLSFSPDCFSGTSARLRSMTAPSVRLLRLFASPSLQHSTAQHSTSDALGLMDMSPNTWFMIHDS